MNQEGKAVSPSALQPELRALEICIPARGRYAKSPIGGSRQDRGQFDIVEPGQLFFAEAAFAEFVGDSSTDLLPGERSLGCTPFLPPEKSAGYDSEGEDEMGDHGGSSSVQGC